MVFDYYGIEKSEEEIAKMCTWMKIWNRRYNIKKVAEELEFKVEIKNESTFEDIQDWLNKKFR